ncbi:MAG: YfhO family protein [Ruminococcus sp.]|nr:YfhO family protein [Ruminococcus sp.]
MDSEMIRAGSEEKGFSEPVMTATQLHKKRADTRIYLLLSFFVPCILVGIGWMLLGVYPFGTGQILVTDFWHQYYPFANILHEKLQSFSSLLYTWDSGLGSNFLAMMAYYAASPLNLLTILVPDAFLREGITLILLMKIGCAGLFMALFLKGVFRRNDVSLCCFSMLYALCSYIMGYYWNTIWIDTVALLPLVMLGVIQLIRDKKCTLYMIALALALISNYYIGLFICIFTVIAFFCICLFEGTRPVRFLKSGLRMLGATAVGLGLSAFMLLPAYFAIQLTNSAENSFPTVVSFYEEWIDLFANMTALRTPTVKEGLPNLYCGIICVVLAGMFLRSRSVRIREKVAAVLVLAFLLVSCNMNKLNFIWHGFHFTNMLPYRFSFLFSFVMVLLAYRAFDLVLEGKIRRLDCIAMTAMAAGFFVITWFSERDSDQTFAMWMSLALSLLYVLILFLYERRILRPAAMCFVLSMGLLVEMFLHVRISTQAVGTSDHTSYPTKNAETRQLLEEINAADDSLFYRTEMTSWYTLNDPALYSYEGVSQFSSMANKSVTTFLRTLGLPGSEAGNRYYYALTSPLTNMFTGIKYVLSRNGPIMDTATMKQIGAAGTMRAYENQYALTVGFMVNEEILSYDGTEYANPFEAQNTLFARATGIDEPLFTPIDVTHTRHSGMASENGVYRSGYGIYTFRIDESASSHTFQFNFIPEEDSVLYAYFWADGVSNVNILQDQKDFGNYNVTRQQGFIAPIGTCEAGVKASVSASVTDQNTKHGSLRIYVYRLNMDVLDRAYEQLLSGSIQLEEFSDTSLSGTVKARADGLCYFSIPQEKGWTAYVDGAPVPTETVGGAMLAVPVPAGTHTVALSYRPQGFAEGMTLTGAAAAVWITVFVIEKRRCGRKPAGPAVQTDIEEEI